MLSSPRLRVLASWPPPDMLIKMLSHYAGPNGTCPAGGIIDIPSRVEAYGLIEGGYAEQVESEPPAIEQAVGVAPETATTVPPKRGIGRNNKHGNRG